MYLKSLAIENYRKFRNTENILEVAYENEVGENLNVARNTTLIVGRNNSGKTTVIELLEKLAKTHPGTNPFNVQDFNLNYLQELYDKYLNEDMLTGEDRDIELPYMQFSLTVGIDNFEENSLANFENILVLGNILPEEGEELGEKLEFKITIKYQSHEETKLLYKLKELYRKFNEEPIEKNSIISGETEDLLPLKEHILKKQNGEYQTDRSKLSYIEYLESQLFKKFLSIIDNSTFKLSFYPENSTEEAEKFSLNKLFDIKMIKANNINGDNSLSAAYNKIINTFISNLDEEHTEKKKLQKLLEDINFGVKMLIDDNYTKNLNNVIQEIESSKTLQMNLLPDITISHILKNSISYEYKENNNFIPEKQFGLGYTNLMVIIAELVEYIDLYKKENYTDKINIICIEEPETYMHPQMQELFINNIESAIDILYQNKSSNETTDGDRIKINYQLIISTHSPHILNSKIHAGSTFNNINYLSQMNNISAENLIAKIVPLSDEGIISMNDNGKIILNEVEVEKISLKQSLTFIKKHMRLETSNLLFADAAIIVEGPTEEALMKYLISKDEVLSKHYITVLCINGAFGKVYFNLIQQLGIPSVLYTDIDFKRKSIKDKNNLQPHEGYPQMKRVSSEDFVIEGKFTTNDTLLYFLSILSTDKDIKEINEDSESEKIKEFFIKKSIVEGKEGEFVLMEIGEKLSILSQWKVDDFYATSLEEAIILENHTSEYLKAVLKGLLPKLYNKISDSELWLNSGGLKNYSYYFQSKIGENNKKTDFMNTLIFDDITERNQKEENGITYEPLRVPQYLKKGLEILTEELEGKESE